MKQKVFYALIFLLITSCMEKFSIPNGVVNENLDGLSAGDTTFIQINPSWGVSSGFTSPNEISIAQDGRIYIADSSSASICVLDQDGEKPIGFETLLVLNDSNGDLINPTDVDIDKKMNVYFIDGSERIFVWNQYWNEIGIKKVSTSGVFTHIETQVDTLVFYGSDLWFAILNSESEWSMKEINGEENQTIIDSLTNPHIFYDGSSETNQFLDAYYSSELSTFSGLTTTYDSGNYIYVADNYGGTENQHRIIEIAFQRSLLIELNNDEFVWAFKGQFGSTLKGYGTGSGTVNSPISLDMDYQGNIYYTQEGDFFPLHMIKPNLSGDFATFTSGFQPNSDDIMNSTVYNQFSDVFVDNSRNVYAVDKKENVIHVFNSNGQFFKSIDLLNNNIPLLNSPSAVAVDERGVVYVCNSGDNTIHRFKLSNSLDEDLTSED
jgi:hypothetical protein